MASSNNIMTIRGAPSSSHDEQDENISRRSKPSKRAFCRFNSRKKRQVVAASLSVFLIMIVCTATKYSPCVVEALVVQNRSSMVQHRRIISYRPSSTTTTSQLYQNAISGNSDHYNNNNSENDVPPMISEVDVLYGYKTPLVFDSSLQRYVPSIDDNNSQSSINGRNTKNNKNRKVGPIRRLNRKLRTRFIPTLRAAFLPEGVAPSYYTFVKWRFLQRYINANVHVIGTQSLLMGLGLKSKNLGLSAAMNWVLKDALGKMTRMIWASKMGRKFDSDAKRWRFRSSLLFAMGNFLEIVTYIFPQLFLLWATFANCFKQISMLTSSSTRTAIYNSFRDGSRENIGDIIAKGEAQIAVVDLLGISSGVLLSRLIGMSIRRVLALYLMLQAFEIFCMYKEIGAVEFRMLNFERLVQIVNKFVESTEEQSHVVIPSPSEMRLSEKIFLPPDNLERRAIAFGSLGRAKLAPDELSKLMNIFQGEKFLLVVGADVKNHRRKIPNAALNCHVVLHVDANNVDIVKGTLALSILRRKLVKRAAAEDDDQSLEPTLMRSSDCFDLIEESKMEANSKFPALLKKMSILGWAAPARFMFGRVTMRADWPLSPPPSNQKSNNKNNKEVHNRNNNNGTQALPQP